MKRTTLILCLSLAGIFGGGEASAHHTEADCPLIFSACSIQYWDHGKNACVSEFEPTTKPCEGGSTCLQPAYCDGAGTCNNTSAVSFVERSKPNVICAPAGSSCEKPSVCEYVGGDGGLFDIVGYECGPHRLESASTVCRPSASTCDAAESCTGLSRLCPGDEAASDSTLCRSAVGACDVSDFCDGVSKDCADEVLPQGETCRGTENQCDVGEVCDGTSPFCPEDELADAITCDDGDECTDGDTCTQGQCIGNGIESCSIEEPDAGPGEGTPDTGPGPGAPDAGPEDESDAGDDSGSGGCSTTGQSSPIVCAFLFLTALLWTRRRRLTPIHSASRNE